MNPPTDNIPSPRKRADFPQVFRHERTLANRLRETNHGSTAPPPERCPAKNHLGEMDHPRLLCATEQVASSALPSRFRASGSKGERWKMTVQCQNRANCAGIYRCQIRAHDEK